MPHHPLKPIDYSTTYKTTGVPNGMAELQRIAHWIRLDESTAIAGDYVKIRVYPTANFITANLSTLFRR
jgi:hypothetical protein